MSISSLLFTSRDSLLAHQLAIDITGANIANVDTAGYTRQRVDFKSTGSANIAGYNAQVGVTVGSIERTFDSHIESQITDQRQNMGYSDAFLQGLQNIEVMLDDTNGGGINEALNSFWSAWENLSENPSGKVERSALVSAAKSLTGSFNSFRENLYSINMDLNRNISDVVSQVNDRIVEITDLNARIIGTGADTGERNTLLDKRTEALKELGSLIDVNAFESDDGSLNVFISNGQPLLQGTLGHTLSVKLTSTLQSEIYSTNLTGETIDAGITKGKLGAFIDLQRDIVPEYVEAIDAVALALNNRINELHRSGYDNYQNTGTDFFTIVDLDNASGTINLNAVIAADTNRIAASGSVNGDAEIASKISSAQNELLMNNNTATLNSSLAAIVGKIGHQVSSAATDNDHQMIITNQLSNQRESVSGVSLDEEMIRLIKYQMGYTAAGKLCSTVNEMLDTLMSLAD